ncbi:hypothetical protein [Methylocaldum marinum]|nr:hypothetical protein [Methylocaldum marinum]
MEFWQTIAATVIGGVITLATTILTINHQKALDKNRRKLEKIEKVYELLSKLESSYRMEWASDCMSINNRKYSDQFRIKERLPFEEIKMLIGFYAPELKEDADKLIALSKDRYGKLKSSIVDIEMSSMSTDETDTLKQQLTTVFYEIKNDIESIQNKLVKIGDTLI